MTVRFLTDRELTQVERDSLEATVYTQVAEPQVLSDPDADWVDAEYQTMTVSAVLEVQT